MIFASKNPSRIVSLPGHTAAVFRCAAPLARAVFLAADFNGWSDYATPLEKSPDGFWTVAIALAPGRYEFKFVVDGAWHLANGGEDASFDGRDNCHPNPFGTMNHVIEIGAKAAVAEFQLGAIGTEVRRVTVA